MSFLGGQKQRVAIARALINQPRLLLLDEPLAALDLKLREQMQLELINLQKAVGITFIYVTHDQGEALALSHRIAVMNQGKVAQLDEPSKIYSTPQNRFVADFIGQCNLLPATVQAIQAGLVKIDIQGVGISEAPCATQTMPVVGQSGVLAIRPEKVKIATTLPLVPGEIHAKGYVHDCLYLGDVTIYIVELENGTQVEAMLPNSASGRAKFHENGDSVEVGWASDAGYFLID